MERKRITVEEAATDPTNVYEVRPYGDEPIESVTVFHDSWVVIRYANGGVTSGIPKHWLAFVRVDA